MRKVLCERTADVVFSISMYVGRHRTKLSEPRYPLKTGGCAPDVAQLAQLNHVSARGVRQMAWLRINDMSMFFDNCMQLGNRVASTCLGSSVNDINVFLTSICRVQL